MKGSDGLSSRSWMTIPLRSIWVFTPFLRSSKKSTCSRGLNG